MSTKLGEKLVPLLGDMWEKLEELRKWFAKKENQEKVQDWIDAFKAMADRLDDIASAAGAVASAFGTIFSPLVKAWNALPEWLRNWIKAGMPLVPGMGRVQAPGGRTMLAVSDATVLSARSARSASPVDSGGTRAPLVTDEQLARAVYSLLMRSGVRNGVRQAVVL
jgi:hypothetical protein